MSNYFDKMCKLTIVLEGDNRNLKSKREILGRVSYHGYTYNTSYIRGDPPKRYMKCCKAKKLSCRARAMMDLNSGDITIFSEHNHPSDTNDDKILEFLTALKRSVENNRSVGLKSVYQMVEDKYPEGASLKPYESIRCSMSRWRRREQITQIPKIIQFK